MEKTIASQSYFNLINWLTDARISRGLSIRQLATDLGLPPNTIHRIETLERRLDVNEYVLYCRALNVDPIKGIKLFYSDIS